MSLTVAWRCRPQDREELARWTAVAVDAGGAGAAGPDRAAGRRRASARTRSCGGSGCRKPTVIAWKKRYAAEGIAGLDDRPKPGRPPAGRRGRGRAGDAGAAAGDAGGDALVEPAAGRPAGDLRRHRWPRIWRKWGLQPWRRETFKFSTDPELEAKIRDVVGLYLDPPEKAVVLCVDEKSQIQALDRTAPILPMRPGLPEKAHPRLRPARHHHPVRRAGGRHRQGHRRLLPAAPPRRVPALPQAGRQGLPAGEAARRAATTTPPTSTPTSQAWLARNPRITLHFTPTSGSWLNMVEIFFGIITRQAIRRGTFTSRQRPHRRDRDLHRRLERPLPTLHLDQDRRPDPPQRHRRSKNIIHATLGRRPWQHHPQEGDRRGRRAWRWSLAEEPGLESAWYSRTW